MQCHGMRGATNGDGLSRGFPDPWRVPQSTSHVPWEETSGMGLDRGRGHGLYNLWVQFPVLCGRNHNLWWPEGSGGGDDALTG